jgi:hypothetical protein
MLSVTDKTIILNDTMLSVTDKTIILSDTMLSVVMLNVVMLSALAPYLSGAENPTFLLAL